MKNSFVVAFAIVACIFVGVHGAPAPGNDVEIVRQDSDVQPEGFNYAYETSDGAKSQAQGQLKNVGTEAEAISVSGSYSFVGDDGQTYTVNYVADENGFQPQGAHLPVAPQP